MTLDEIIDGRDAEDMTVFDIDWEESMGYDYHSYAQEVIDGLL